MNIKIGGTATLSGEFLNGLGNPFDPLIAFIEIKDPSGAIVTSQFPGTVVRDSVGNYHIDFEFDKIGEWHYRWLSEDEGAEGSGVGIVIVESDGF